MSKNPKKSLLTPLYIKLSVSTILLATLISGCGQKGPLRKPEPVDNVTVQPLGTN